MKSVIIAMGVFFLTCSAWAGTFIETFEDGNLEGWRELILFDLKAPGPWKIVDGELQLRLKLDDGGVTRLLTIGKEMWQNYDIELDVKPLKKHGPGNIAIAARVNQTWGVVCTIGDLPMPEDQSMARCFGGDLHGTAFLHFERKLHRSLKVRRWATMKLSVHGKQLTFWLNGKLVLGPIVLEAIGGFPDYPNGKTGFGASNYSVIFDNITITGDGISSRGGLSVSPRVKLATTWGRLKRF